MFIAYPLLISLVLLLLILLRRGFALKALLGLCIVGIRQALPVVSVLLLIGIVSAVWTAAGTVPALVYYGTGLISPHFFLLWAFVLTGVVSVLMGTSFGTVATLGVALMVIARSSDPQAACPVAGAVIAGAFVGDRCSPMSSSAHLVASVTSTSLHTNLRNMLMSGIWPMAIALIFYGGLSLKYPLSLASNPITTELPSAFNLSFAVLLPAVVLLLLAIMRVDVKLAMAVSIGFSCILAYTIQHYSLLKIAQFALFGFQLDKDSPLTSILIGGGLLPMAKATVVVFISTAFAGVFAGSRILKFVDVWLAQVRSPLQLKRATTWLALLTNAFGCTQTIAILMTGQLMKPHYQQAYKSSSQQTSQQNHQQSPHKIANEQLALTLEDTAVVIAPLIPWNIAGLIPATILGVGPGFIPYAVYLFLLPMFVVLKKDTSKTTRF